MILSKSILKYLLDKSDSVVSSNLQENQLQKEIKCDMLTLELDHVNEDEILEDIVIKFINLCELEIEEKENKNG